MAGQTRRTARDGRRAVANYRLGSAHMRRPIATTVSLVLLAITTGCGHASAAAPSVSPSFADVVDVDCSPSGTRASATHLTVQRDGAHIRVQNTSGSSGVYLNYRNGEGMGEGGGQPVGSGTLLVLPLAPGPVQLHCSYDQSTREDRPVSIDLLDPDRSWRTGALAALGCPPPEKSLVDWIYRPGSGSTADAALAALTAQLDEPSPWRHVPEGYEAAASQTYVLMRAGKPWATASVVRSAADSYQAQLGSLCR